MKLKCLIVDDEELAIKVLQKYIATVPTLELTGSCDNAMQAISFLHNHKVDLLFLDINMPEMSGLEMLKTLNDPPRVILTTAHSEYALESYEYGVVDYLLKPIKLERFIKAINTVAGLYNIKPADREESPKFIFIKEEHITHKVDCTDILYVEAYGNYLKIYTKDKTYVQRETMNNIQKRLPDDLFIRVHKSYIINLSQLTKISGNVLFINSVEIPLGSIYKLALQQRINQQ